MKYKYQSIYKDVINELIDEKHSLGFKYETAEWKLKELDLLALKLNIDKLELTKEFVNKFVKKKPNEKQINTTNRIGIIRTFAKFMIRKGYNAYVMPPLPRGSYNNDFVPYIFIDAELKKIFNAASNIDFNKYPTRKKYSIIFKILYSTGMRIGEVTHLKVKNIDFNNNTFFIENAKNNKERKIPVHYSIIKEIKEYSIENYILEDEHYIFCNRYGKPIDISTVNEYFRRILWKAGIHHGGRSNGPCVHSFRHTYCVHKLREWIINGNDVTALFPYLCAYMGHADTRCTEYYLRLTADLYPDIITKSEEYFNGDIDEK